MMSNTILIVGAGFCGSVLAANLLRRPPAGATEIVLVERGSEIGRGVAYAARDYPYLLNVPAARLSADSQDPMQFLRYVLRQMPNADGEDFLPRALYGDYLQQMLLDAERAAPSHVRLRRVFGEVCDITPHNGSAQFAAQLRDRTAIPANWVILALGNPPPPLLPWAEEISHHASYRHDPWELPGDLSSAHSVLIVGNGLTMADTALGLTRDANRAPMLHSISRRGLVPQVQTAFPATAHFNGATLLSTSHSIREVFAASRAMAREAGRAGGDWREVVTFIRHLAPTLWQRLPDKERRRFLRHLQAYWDVHRHRLPPALAAHIEALRSAGRLQANAGRILKASIAGDRLRVLWRPRGSETTATLVVDALINATGPDYALEHSADPLMKALRSAGRLSADALNLGLRTAQYGACVNARGVSDGRLLYLGPMLRADHWEATAATELRNHAEILATHLAASA